MIEPAIGRLPIKHATEQTLIVTYVNYVGVNCDDVAFRHSDSDDVAFNGIHFNCDNDNG